MNPLLDTAADVHAVLDLLPEVDRLAAAMLLDLPDGYLVVGPRDALTGEPCEWRTAAEVLDDLRNGYVPGTWITKILRFRGAVRPGLENYR